MDASVQPVLVALIGALALVLVALIPVLVGTAINARSAARTSRASLSEVRNDHSKNMRDDVDDKHNEVMRLLRAHGRRLGRLERSQHDSRASMFELRAELRDVDERTQPRNTTPRRKK